MRLSKIGRIKKSGKAYHALVDAVSKADGDRCVLCYHRVWGYQKSFCAHHIIRRSRIRLDTFNNLMMLCRNCHDQETRHEFYVIWADIKTRRAEKVTRGVYVEWVREHLEELRKETR